MCINCAEIVLPLLQSRLLVVYFTMVAIDGIGIRTCAKPCEKYELSIVARILSMMTINVLELFIREQAVEGKELR